MAESRISSFEEFWPHYVRAHVRKGTRLLHGAGSSLALLALLAGLVVSPWWILLAPIIGYGFAWYGHFFVEHNNPATFEHPFWSLVADYRMLFFMLTGQMERHVREAQSRVRHADPDMMSAEDL